MRDAFCEVDLTGRFVECNTAYETMTGYTRAELGALTYQELTPAKWRDFESEIIREEILKDGFSRVYEKEYVRKNGTVFPVELRAFLIRDGKGEPSAIWAIVRDITDRKRAEERIGRSEEFLRAILDSLSDHIVVLDSDGTIIATNEAWRRFAQANGLEHLDGIAEGADYLEVCRKAIREAVEDAPEILRGIERVLAGELPLYSVEYPCHSPTEQRWFVMRATRLSDKQGSGAVISHQNITDRKRLEEQLHSRQMELNHAQRLSTAGELASDLAHELNQPLTAILSQAERCQAVLGDNPPGSDKLSGKLERIVQQAQRAAKIIATMRHFIRRDPERTEPIDLNGSIREVLELMEIECRRFQIRVDLDLYPEMPLVSGVAIQIQQVLVNVLQNAFEAMQDTPPAQRSVTVTTRVESESVNLSIRDRGRGIGPDQKDHLFDPFYTTKPNGLGLGLPLCRSILERHRGSIQVIQNTDCGVTVQIVIPLGMSVSRG
jgi:two-component system, LuxR family, sensor kinase FixL